MNAPNPRPDPFALAKPYRVSYGHGLGREDFATFREALSFYATKRGASITNRERCDGSPDARNPHGLTESERDAMENVLGGEARERAALASDFAGWRP